MSSFLGSPFLSCVKIPNRTIFMIMQWFNPYWLWWMRLTSDFSAGVNVCQSGLNNVDVCQSDVYKAKGKWKWKSVKCKQNSFGFTFHFLPIFHRQYSISTLLDHRRQRSFSIVLKNFQLFWAILNFSTKKRPFFTIGQPLGKVKFKAEHCLAES